MSGRPSAQEANKHNHGKVETTNVISVIPGDVALTLKRLLNTLEEEPMLLNLMAFCGSKRHLDRFAEWSTEFRGKVDGKFDQDFIDKETHDE